MSKSNSYLRDKHDPPEGSLGDDLIDQVGDHEIRIDELEKAVSKLKSERDGARRSAGIAKSKLKNHE